VATSPSAIFEVGGRSGLRPDDNWKRSVEFAMIFIARSAGPRRLVNAARKQRRADHRRGIGIGASMARIFAGEGAKVVVADVLKEEGRAVVSPT
jgi:hypothetical protein